MRPMNRLGIALAALALPALLAFSCAKADKSKPRIGLAMRAFDDEASVAIRGSIETAALGRAELAIIDGGNQQGAQDLQLPALLQRKLGCLAINPVDGASLGSLIVKAKAAKVPLVFFGLEPPDETMRSWDKLFFVGTREADAGTAQGEILASYWKSAPGADRNKDGLLQFAALISAPDGRGPGTQAEAAAKALGASGVRSAMQAMVLTAGGMEAARQKAAELIAEYGDKIEALICGDDETALGAIEALKAAGYYKGKKYTPVIGAGEGEPSTAIAEALASGRLLGTAVRDRAAQGKAVFDLAYALARNAAPAKSGWKITDAKYVWVPCKKLTKESLPARK
jgi:methyl-galactoside transport system substrate-binding protein